MNVKDRPLHKDSPLAEWDAAARKLPESITGADLRAQTLLADRLISEMDLEAVLCGFVEEYGHAMDASTLVMLTYPKVESMKPVIDEMRPIAISVLERAGYCRCGRLIQVPRCPSCSTRHGQA